MPTKLQLKLVGVAALLVAAGLFLTRPSYSLEKDLAELPKHTGTFEELSSFFKERALEKGAIYGFDLLRNAELPQGTDFHLLGHVVGDVLYKQKGKKAISLCTDEFRNACSHSIVVGTLLSEGENALADMNEACKKAPGGKGAYAMCFHGLGHGVLAYANYDFEKGAKLCQKLGENINEGVEVGECVGGMIMEIVSGGDHDKESWQKGRDIYLDPNAPLSTCMKEVVPQEARRMCVLYMTPYVMEASGANLEDISLEDMEKAFALCNKAEVPQHLKDVCAGGFGKEFVVLAQERDIRNIDKMNEKALLKVHEYCSAAGDLKSRTYCTLEAVNSLYWGGENHYSVAINFCNLAPESIKDSCFSHLIGGVHFYSRDNNYIKGFCQELPEEYKRKCTNY